MTGCSPLSVAHRRREDEVRLWRNAWRDGLDSPLIAVVAVTDLMREGMIVASDTFRALEVYTFVVVYYVVTILWRGRYRSSSGLARCHADRGG